jgi:hypothetical protein
MQPATPPPKIFQLRDVTERIKAILRGRNYEALLGARSLSRAEGTA